MAIDKVKSPVAAEGGKSSAFAEGLPKAANIKFPLQHTLVLTLSCCLNTNRNSQMPLPLLKRVVA